MGNHQPVVLLLSFRVFWRLQSGAWQAHPIVVLSMIAVRFPIELRWLVICMRNFRFVILPPLSGISSRRDFGKSTFMLLGFLYSPCQNELLMRIKSHIWWLLLLSDFNISVIPLCFTVQCGFVFFYLSVWSRSVGRPAATFRLRT